MKLLLTADRVAAVAERWKEQYYHPLRKGWYSEDRLAVWSNLLTLPSGATAEMVDNMIGNDSWTIITCAECERKVNAVIIFNADDDYHSMWICRECLAEALTRLETTAF